MSTQDPLKITIFGATGGTGLALLRECLSSPTPIQITTLVRTPSKLLSLLNLATAPSNLTIIHGSIADTHAVRSALTGPTNTLPALVITAIGLSGDFTSLQTWKNLDLHICEHATKAIVDAISALHRLDHTRPKPLLVALSTTGISLAGRDIPVVIVPLYHYLLATPHRDKAAMEANLLSLSAASSNDDSSELAQPWIVIRPSFLRGDGKGARSKKKVRVGLEKEGKIEAKEVGYTIGREDVGGWLFDEVVQGGEERWGKLVGRMVSLTW